MNRTTTAAVLAVVAFAGIGAGAGKQRGAARGGGRWWAGRPCCRTRNIVENAANSADHTTLVAAVQAAGLVETLQGTGPFTVFAPVNDAFENLPEGTVQTLLRPENKAALTKVLTYHVVPGRVDGGGVDAAHSPRQRLGVAAHGQRRHPDGGDERPRQRGDPRRDGRRRAPFPPTTCCSPTV